ncbi:MAG: GNAT family N-acetyltransferase [Pseudomonadota bacterium]
MTEITRATLHDADEVARLFDLYRQFYECEPDYPLAQRFITERLRNDESIVFVARQADQSVGFVQLYPSFCSVEAIRIFILYDLFVDASVRNAGIGRDLMNRASDYCRSEGARRVDLLTAHSNAAGQHLYESLGYEKTNQDFFAYSLAL